MANKITNALSSLQVELRRMKFKRSLPYEDIIRGNCAPLLPVLHFALLDFSTEIAKMILNNGILLNGCNDMKFVENCFKVARSILGISSIPLTVKQFLQNGFAAEHKILFCVSVLKAVQAKVSSLGSAKKTHCVTQSSKENITSRRSSLEGVSAADLLAVAKIEAKIATIVSRVDSTASKLDQIYDRVDNLALSMERVCSM